MVIGKQAEPKLSICLLSIPLGEWKGSHTLVLNFLRVLLPSAEKIHLITGNYPEGALPDSRVDLANVRSDPLTSYPQRRLVRRAGKYVAAQLKISWRLARVACQVDVVIFFIDGGGMLLPMLTAQVLRKKTVIVAVDAGPVVIRNVYKQSLGGVGGVIAAGIFSVLHWLNYRLCDRIAISSPSLVARFGLARHRDKISVVHEHYVDLDKFKVEKPLCDRSDLVGYIGRLSEEKGILGFLDAISQLAAMRDEVTFLICGNGQLRAEVEACVVKLGKRVRFVGWVPHDELPQYLNELKLLVIPSDTESGPNIAFEAMACGTPVLGTTVGLMAEVLADGCTGFIMHSNSPECIAENVLRALSQSDLEQIARNARALVQREFTFEKAVAGYRNLLRAVLR